MNDDELKDNCLMPKLYFAGIINTLLAADEWLTKAAFASEAAARDAKRQAGRMPTKLELLTSRNAKAIASAANAVRQMLSVHAALSQAGVLPTMGECAELLAAAGIPDATPAEPTPDIPAPVIWKPGEA